MGSAEPLPLSCRVESGVCRSALLPRALGRSLFPAHRAVGRCQLRAIGLSSLFSRWLLAGITQLLEASVFPSLWLLKASVGAEPFSQL